MTTKRELTEQMREALQRHSVENEKLLAELVELTKPKLDKSEQAHLEEVFYEVTGLPPAERETAKQRKASAELYWQPLAYIVQNYNGRSESLLRAAVAQMRADRLTISSVKSILAVVKSLAAEEVCPAARTAQHSPAITRMLALIDAMPDGE